MPDRVFFQNDEDWLEMTYPLPRGTQSTESERAAEQQQFCLRRLEEICWPKGPECPRCHTQGDAGEWRGAPRGRGWRCRTCGTRFHVLQAVPAMARTHIDVRIWFRAIFLLGEGRDPSSVALGKRLGLEQKIAWKLKRAIRQMERDSPEITTRVIYGQTGEAERKQRATSRRAPRKVGRSDLRDQAAPSGTRPSAWDPD